MARSPHSDAASEPPAALINERRAGWHAFTRAIMLNCVAVAALLFFLLLVFKIL
jgi:hypothetical protein